MLRATSNNLSRVSTWKNTAIYSSVKNYTTPAPTTETKEKPSLSQRLGGTGRGKVMSDSSDPFASFLANAKKPRNNNNRNGNFTPRARKPQQSEGQFADAIEQQPKQQRSRNDNNRNNRQNNKQNESQSDNGAVVAKDNNRRNNNNRNNNNRNNAQNGGRKLNLRRTQQPQEIRTRRATTFIDKDIDWASFDTTTLSTEALSSSASAETAVTEQDSDELVSKELQGDYHRYISAGSDMKWPQMIQGATLSTLVGSNPTFDLQQKTAFLAALSNATNGNAASVRK